MCSPMLFHCPQMNTILHQLIINGYLLRAVFAGEQRAVIPGSYPPVDSGPRMRDRGLLTESDREKLARVDDIDELDDQTRANLRSKWNRRIGNLEEDIALLREIRDEKTLERLQRVAGVEAELERRVERIEQALELADE